MPELFFAGKECNYRFQCFSVSGFQCFRVLVLNTLHLNKNEIYRSQMCFNVLKDVQLFRSWVGEGGCLPRVVTRGYWNIAPEEQYGSRSKPLRGMLVVNFQWLYYQWY